MSHDVIKVDYDLMEEMKRTFLQGVEQLQDTNQVMQTVASELEDGALLGRGGTAFTDAIRSKLCPAVAKLTEKFNELAQDVQSAVDLMREADEDKSAPKFD